MRQRNRCGSVEGRFPNPQVTSVVIVEPKFGGVRVDSSSLSLWINHGEGPVVLEADLRYSR